MHGLQIARTRHNRANPGFFGQDVIENEDVLILLTGFDGVGLFRRKDQIRLAERPFVLPSNRGGQIFRIALRAPPSTHLTTVAISSSVRRGSIQITAHRARRVEGGISRPATFSLIARAQGRDSS